MPKVKLVDFFPSDIQEQLLQLIRDSFGDVEISDDPDFVIYSSAGYEHLKYDCVRIFWTGENLRPDFNICDYAIGFDHISFGDRYLRSPLYYYYKKDYDRARQKHINPASPAEKTGFCNFIYSNGTDCVSQRGELFDVINSYKRVDAPGKMKNNMPAIGYEEDAKYNFQKNYKFTIACENSSMPGYTTEKILQAFAAGTIPIYWGDPRIAEEFNPKAFINCNDYDSFEAVLEEVKRIDADDELYMSYMREPAGTTEQLPEDPLAENREFFRHIFAQTPQEAMRRCNDYHARWYQEIQRIFRKHEKLVCNLEIWEHRRRKLWGIITRKGDK